jgi:hypothetical protein
MRTDTRTLEERIADRDAKRVVATIEQASIQASCETRRLWGSKPRDSPLRDSRSVARVIRLLGATTSHDWPVRPGTRSGS